MASGKSGDVETTSAVQQFYAAKVVFLTGGTGFLGKLLIHKLIRLNVHEVVLLSRPKKGKTIDQRMEQIFQDPLFVDLARQHPEYRQKIKIFDGDMQQEELGLTKEQQDYLAHNVSIVLHAAADVRFDQTVKNTVLTNVFGTRTLMQMCTNFQHLEAFVFVSTAFANYPEQVVREEFYPPPIDPEEIIKAVSNLPEVLEKPFERIRSEIIHPWANSYVYSKAITEDVVRQFGHQIPVAVVRPSIVVSTASDPFPGWTDNIYGLNGIVTSTAVGLLHVFCCNFDDDCDIIPADIVVDTILVAAHQVFVDSSMTVREGIVRHVVPKTKIYNCVSQNENPITWRMIRELSMDIGATMPPIQAIWMFFLVLTRYPFVQKVCNVIFHLVPALIFDMGCRVGGWLRLTHQEPKLFQTYKKINKFMNAVEAFSLRTWVFEDKNMVALYENLSEVDQRLFHCTVKRFVWKEFFQDYLWGLRKHLLKEPPTNLEVARKRFRKLEVAHACLKVFMFSLISCLFLLLFKWSGLWN